MRRERNFIGPAGMGGMVSLWGASSLIKSIQRGTVALVSPNATGTATITAVVPENTVIVYNALTQGQANNNFAVAAGRIILTNSTTVTLNLGANAGNVSAGFEVVEFYPGVLKSVQRGTIAVGNNASATATITDVNTAKALLVSIGWSMSTVAAPTTDQYALNQIFTNSTTITATRYVADSTNPITAAYQVVEFF